MLPTEIFKSAKKNEGTRKMPWKQRDNAPRLIRHVRCRLASESETKTQQRATHRLLVELVRQERARREETHVPQQIN
jgi:hypothetical protein